ncbi:helix-turn-helix domain-containing protein [Anoxybacillus flavithermus]|uniref:helix-turn-helix domain-containing protein n=1 Tax=Anoxybacillus flavithermus TaxID=33934 RepID=UPI0018682960|nr:helix-turn-helix domain-containing protein [Anoxybacillus flavithermus]MBE2919373.1 helix-turn-helix domain-containing protein [Anoxybacillus flavithermus]
MKMNFEQKFDKYKGISGIYKITNIKTGKIYIGSAVDLRRRFYAHLKSLRRNAHDNKYLQNAWNKYGEDSFSFDVIEIVEDKEKLLEVEQKWIDQTLCYKRDKGYNISPTAGSTLGLKHTKEQRLKNSLAKRGSKSPNHTIDESIAKEIKLKLKDGLGIKEVSEMMNVSYDIVKSIKEGKAWNHVLPEIDLSKTKLKSKLEEKDVIEIKKMLNNGKKVKEIAKIFGVSYRTISAIKNGIIWSNVGDEIKAKKRKKLSIEDVIEIKKMIKDGFGNKEIAEKFGVSRSTISCIRTGVNWSEVNIDDYEKVI